MSRKNATRLAELNRAGFPFDPTRPANWFAGIMRSLLARNHPTDRVDLLAKQTLKQMNILTKGGRRQFILSQVEYAIKQLCDRKVLLLYTPTRVRLWDGLPQTKLERYLTNEPIPWEVVRLPEPGRRDIHQPESEDDPEPDRNDTRDFFDDEAIPPPLDEEPILPLPKLKPAVGPISSDEGATPIRWTPEPEPLPDPWGQEEGEIIDALLQPGSTTETEPAIRATPFAPADEVTALGAVERAIGTSPLEDVVNAIREKGESVSVSSKGGREAVLSLSHGDQIELMWRRGGDLRVFVRFPGTELTRVLQHIGARWVDMVVGLNRNGCYGVQRTIPATTSPSSVATTLLKDVQELEDAIATVQ